MSTAEIRSEVHRIVDQLDDRFLEVVHSMLGKYAEQHQDEVVGYDVDGTALTSTQAKEVYSKRVEAMKSGQFTTAEDLGKESAKW